MGGSGTVRLACMAAVSSSMPRRGIRPGSAPLQYAPTSRHLARAISAAVNDKFGLLRKPCAKGDPAGPVVANLREMSTQICTGIYAELARIAGMTTDMPPSARLSCVMAREVTS